MKKAKITKTGNPTLAERFLVPPFTVLDARSGWWRNRKTHWIAQGLDSNKGRGTQLLFAKSAQPPSVYNVKNAYDSSQGRKTSWEEFEQNNPGVVLQTGTSIFDPVLCEILYRWFSAPGGLVLDPFAGGSVRGIVAAVTGRNYIGVDINAEQIAANQAQWQQFSNQNLPAPHWICADSRNLAEHCKDVGADFVFSCPPYGDLEVYSDNPADLSTMRYPQFLSAYKEVIAASIAHLKNDRFACFVVGDIRDKQGIYRNFVAHTIDAFQAAGARLYNEGILLNNLGSLPMRAGVPFVGSRKLGKAHQNVLVFVKGCPRKATACGPVQL